MSVDRTLRYKGSYQGAMALRQRLEDKHVHVELGRKDRKRLERAERRLQQWQVLMEGAELLERQDRERRELLQRLGQEPWELSQGLAQHRELLQRLGQEPRDLLQRLGQERELLQRLGQEPRERRAWQVAQLRELERRHDRERQEVGLPPREWDAEQAPLVSLGQMLDADLDQVGISLRCTGAAAAIAETVKEFREIAPGCEVEVQAEPHSTSTAPLASRRRILGASRRQVNIDRKSTGSAAAITTQTVDQSPKASWNGQAANEGEPRTAKDDGPFPPQAHPT